MTVNELVTQYVAFRRAMGARFNTTEKILRSFCRAVGLGTPAARVRRKAVERFLAGTGPITKTWHCKYDALKGLFQFAVSRGHVRRAPLPTELPKYRSSFVPYIYSRDELRHLLDAIPLSLRSPAVLEPDTLRTILLLLYGTGLRIGEALALSVADVDLPNALLTVRGAKFCKSRLVPVGQQLVGVLAEYARRRAAPHPRDDTGRRFFLGRREAPIQLHTMGATFRRLREHAGIRRSDGARYQPRLHDLRHSFAVHRLLEWYRQGADVQRLVYHLSVYLGHARLAHTQVYLPMTPELLEQAGSCFERYACGGDHHA